MLLHGLRFLKEEITSCDGLFQNWQIVMTNQIRQCLSELPDTEPTIDGKLESECHTGMRKKKQELTEFL